MSEDSIAASTNVAQEGTPRNAEIPIANKATNPGDSEQAERPNKYKYDEFAGFAGERYLDAICQKILPYALWRTWKHAVEYQAPGLPCYVGTARLAERVKPQQRKIEMDLQAFRERGLVSMYADRLPIVQEGGTIKYQAVTVKDWTPLYDLAHEYHLWTLSPHYIPAEREYLELFLNEPELTQKLLRFDNYRRAIMNKKPGRKLTYQCTLTPSGEQPASPAETGGTPVPNAKYYFNASGKTSSAYRESSNSQSLTSHTTNSNSPEEGFSVIAAQTIRSEQQGTRPTKLERRTAREEERTEQSKSSNPHLAPEQEMPPENAEEAEECNIEELKKNPLALAAALADMVEREKKQQAKATRERRKQPQERPRRMVPDWFIRRIAQEAQELGDDPKSLQSVITRLSKTLLAAEQVFTNISQAEVINRMNDARRKVGRHASKIKKRGNNGQKNYMPYFIECFINSWGFRQEELAFIDGDEPLYQDGSISDFVEMLQSQYERSGSALEFGEWVKQRRKQKKQQRN